MYCKTREIQRLVGGKDVKGEGNPIVDSQRAQEKEMVKAFASSFLIIRKVVKT